MFKISLELSSEPPRGLVGFWGFDEHPADNNALDWGPHGYVTFSNFLHFFNHTSSLQGIMVKYMAAGGKSPLKNP
jgi:hypothetical protein